MSTSDEDPVIKEIPVYLSNALQDRLYVYQYPTKPCGDGYCTSDITKVCVKPVHQEVRMELILDTHSVHYDQSKGEMIATSVDGTKSNKASENQFFNSGHMDKVVLQSQRMLQTTKNYAVGFLEDNKLFVSPVTGIISLQPSFQHYDKADKKVKETNQESNDSILSGTEDDEPQAQQVTVKFARRENERMKRARERSYNYFTAKSAEEAWYTTKFHDKNSRLAEVERNKLSGSSQEDAVNTLCLSISQYLDTLAPVMKVDESVQLPDLPSNVMSLNIIKTKSLAEQVEIVIKDVRIITVKQLASLLCVHKDDTAKLLRSLQQVSVLVQGNWVVRSDLVYPKGSVSSHSGVPNEIMARARDYILYLFTVNEYVSRKDITEKVKLPPDELKSILTSIARFRVHKGWELLLPPDVSFMESFHETVERQKMWWDVKLKQLLQSFKSDLTASPTRQRKSSNSSTSSRPRKNSRSRVDSISGSDKEDSPVVKSSPKKRERKRDLSLSEVDSNVPSYKLSNK